MECIGYLPRGNIDFFDFDINDRSHMAWVLNGSSAFMSSVFSHELVEALTDPEGNGVQVNPSNPNNWNEIGDVCATTGSVNGVTVQSYWSEKDKSCVIPADIPVRKQITAIRKNPRQDIFHAIKRVRGIRLVDGASFDISQIECLLELARGNTFFVKGADGSQAEVRSLFHFLLWNPKGNHYIATVAHASKQDNLLSLPEF